MSGAVRVVAPGPRDGPGGTERVAAEIAAALQGEGYGVEWVCPADLPRRPRSTRFPLANPFLETLAMARHVRRLPAVSLTVSHGILGFGARGPRLHVYHGTYAGLATACRAGLPRLDYQVMRRLLGLGERLSGLGAVRVAVSEPVAREVRRYYGLGTHRVIHNGVDTSLFRPGDDRVAARRRLGLPEDALLGLVAGRMDYGKGRAVLAEALEKLKAPLQVLLAAPAETELRGLPPERCRLLPPVAREELPALYRACDLLIAPSLYEGFGLTPIEAWACGTPVVAARSGVLAETWWPAAVADFGVFTFQPGSAAGLRRALEVSASDRRWAGETAAAAGAVVRERFTHERMRLGYLGLIQALL